MAVSKVDMRWSWRSPEELFEKQYTLVKLTEESTIVPAASGDRAFILMDTPKAGDYGTVCLDGVEKCKVGTEVKQGQLVAPNNKGELQPALTGQYIVGMALETGAVGTVVSVLVHAGTGAKA